MFHWYDRPGEYALSLNPAPWRPLIWSGFLLLQGFSLYNTRDRSRITTPIRRPIDFLTFWQRKSQRQLHIKV